MGLFDKIKKAINALDSAAAKGIDTLERKWRDYVAFKKGLTKFRDSLRALGIALWSIRGTIDLIDPEMEEFYKFLKAADPYKYEKDIKAYESHVASIPGHNAMIRRLDADIATFSFQSFIDDPLAHSLDELKRYDKTLEELSQRASSARAQKYNDFCNQIEELRRNFAEIRAQFGYAPHYQSLAAIEGDRYIDSESRKSVLDRVAPIRSSISKAGKSYYPFPNIDHLGELIDKHNEEYIRSHMGDPIFDDVGGRSLDPEQRRSILAAEKACLTIAGAGSGKTLTICGEVKYLLQHDGVKPEDILLLSYSRKSADDLSARVSVIDPRLTVGTFHKIGLDILKEARGVKLTVEEQYDEIVERYFRQEMARRPGMTEKVLDWFAYYLTPNRRNKKYETEGEMFEDLKKKDFKTLKSILLELSLDPEKKETIKKEFVKSFEEMALANFYFINGVDYLYESTYKEAKTASLERRQYTPDFYLPKYRIYHEHFGIGRDGVPHQFEGDEADEYVAGIAWKRAIHRENETTLIETYSYEFDEGTVFSKLEKELKAKGVEFHPLSQDDILKALNSIYQGQNFRSFIKLVSSFLSLYKARYVGKSHIAELRRAKFADAYDRNRANLFLDIVEDVYDFYFTWLRGEGKIDFDDMILQSTEAVDSIGGFNYKHIIVDEFQDISFSRMMFLKKLISRGNSRLYAVGDDWQAIYRFAGCDLDILTRFESYFGRSAINYITSTHRNSQELQDIAGPFVMKNPEQYKKSIKSDKHLENPIKVAWYGDDRNAALLNALDDIHDGLPAGENKARVLVLGRNNHDIDGYLTTDLYLERGDEGLRRIVYRNWPQCEISYSTVHGSKGLEEDFVIIINADDARLGFPNQVEDDEILNLVLSQKSEYEYAEERRLWYVALTRTRSSVYIIASAEFPSPFLKEIIDGCEEINEPTGEEEGEHILCPRCGSGRLRIKERGSDRKKFIGCSNYPYCRYTIDGKYLKDVQRNARCPECGDFLVLRKGRYGLFYSCVNRGCDHTENYEKGDK